MVLSQGHTSILETRGRRHATMRDNMTKDKETLTRDALKITREEEPGGNAA